jgi:hypothetical protein
MKGKEKRRKAMNIHACRSDHKQRNFTLAYKLDWLALVSSNWIISVGNVSNGAVLVMLTGFWMSYDPLFVYFISHYPSHGQNRPIEMRTIYRLLHVSTVAQVSTSFAHEFSAPALHLHDSTFSLPDRLLQARPDEVRAPTVCPGPRRRKVDQEVAPHISCPSLRYPSCFSLPALRKHHTGYSTWTPWKTYQIMKAHVQGNVGSCDWEDRNEKKVSDIPRECSIPSSEHPSHKILILSETAPGIWVILGKSRFDVSLLIDRSMF